MKHIVGPAPTVNGTLIRHMPVRQDDWRAIERATLDVLRRLGCKFRCEHGVTYVIAEFLDEQTGELLARQYVFSVEQFAQDFEHSARGA